MIPIITGTPVIDAPQLLNWPADRGAIAPDLYDPTSNILLDLHGTISSCDLVFSTEGNYHPALRDIWPVFLAKCGDRQPVNYLYSTSPPVVVDHLRNNVLAVGNLSITSLPSVAAGVKGVIDTLAQAGYCDGTAYPLYRDRGAVILVKKGNPKGIETVWDLGRKGVRFATPNPELEPGSFDNYLATLYGIASHDKRAPDTLSADMLIHGIFNGSSDDPYKWLAGPRIHHRDLPWSVAYGRADAALILYHLGLYTVQTFPDLFDAVPLGGTLDDPQPLEGTSIATRFLVRIKGEWSSRQREVREKLVETLLSDEFTLILEKRGLLRPEGFTDVEGVA